MLLQSSKKNKKISENKLNNLGSKEWLKFQKSWFFDGNYIYHDFISFFTKQEDKNGNKMIVGSSFFKNDALEFAATSLGRKFVFVNPGSDGSTRLNYCIIDLRNKFKTVYELSAFLKKNKGMIRLLHSMLETNSYLTIFINNLNIRGTMYPLAWIVGKELGKFFDLKDEKVGCIKNKNEVSGKYWSNDKRIFYCLNFKKSDVKSSREFDISQHDYPHENRSDHRNHFFKDSWFIPRPRPRDNDVKLHPAKFPETMVELFIENFSPTDGLVLDPMAGTGSTLIAALSKNRHAIGIELADKYKKIIDLRVQDFLNEFQGALFPREKAKTARVILGDARDIGKFNLPQIDYCITSPPYWDMLNEKGAETQKDRKERGLDVQYSDDKKDLGNVEDYNKFLDLLEEIYAETSKLLKPGGYLTVIVKNVKKKGQIYPLAWDIAERLKKYYILCDEQIWCQDDLSIMPFGYRYAWVSNTFHHYCLNFRKPN